MFYLRDALYAIWYLLGEFLIKHLWGDINKRIATLEAACTACRDREHELVRQCEDSIARIQQHRDEDAKLYDEAIKDIHEFYSAKLHPQKPQAKRKAPSKVSKPIKPRAKKKVK